MKWSRDAYLYQSSYWHYSEAHRITDNCPRMWVNRAEFEQKTDTFLTYGLPTIVIAAALMVISAMWWAGAI